MKTFFTLCLVLLAASAADAEVFRPQHVSGGRSPQGHAGNSHSTGYGNVGYGHSYPSYANHHSHGGYGYYGGPYGYGYLPRYGYGYGYGYPYYSGYGYGYPYYGGYGYGYPYYGAYGYGYPSYGSTGYYASGPAATTGLLLGALAGAVVGNNSSDFHHNAWYGSTWGAGLGWVLGSAVDATRRPVEYASAPAVVQQAPAVQSQQPQSAAAAPSQPVTIINNYYNSSTPMGAANGMFGR